MINPAPRKHSSVGKAIRFVTSCAGMAVGWKLGERTNAYVRSKIGNERIDLAHDNETPSAADVAIAVADTTLGSVNRGGSIAGGIYLGYKAGDALCKWLKVDE